LLKILIAEDDVLVADMLERTIHKAGYKVCGTARTVSQAVALGELHRPDLAIFDVRLANGDCGTEIVARLRRRLPTLGVLYATGDIGTARLTSRDGHGCLGKPYTAHDLVRALKLVEEIVAAGSATSSVPARFQLLAPSPATRPAPGGRSDG
jgi:ActR/RegA family two-component response regulator